MNGQQDELLEQLLAARFPLFRLAFLEQMHDELADVVKKNGGNAEVTIRFKGGEDQWQDWDARQLARPGKRRYPIFLK